ncbi:SDR family oxidoreductase [Azospirillum canadense]|uniref:SDR family oxidoreductase n=1 Tax=Azospirillum canadense TaxID=403962 RepID=UPI0022273F90|nr:SDR family oxidoreductase [Azospirillum canadense]MCW2238742.1 NAD(P)-dependent dehydrogenase (short-subunit alcohol dehydrogenase family) [Azospirillum canadense]
MSHALTNSRVLVIGGSSGIGLATAKAAAQAGASVTIASRSQDKLDAAVAAVGGNTRAAVLDTRDDAAVERFFTGEAPWDHIVVSAAQTPSGPVRTLGLSDAKAAMESKFWGAYRVAKAAKISEGGSLTFVSGFLSVRPSATSVLQGAINAALEALARGLALELAPVRVNAVSPGLIATPLWSGLSEAKREAMFAGAAQRLPARRVGQPEDIANAILFLASTSFATGSTVRVDGGGAIA